MLQSRTTEAALHELVARRDIRDALMRNARGVDRLDRDLILSSYHPGAVDNHGGYNGSAEGLADWILGRHVGAIPYCAHLLAKPRLRVQGDVAYGETYNCVFYRIPAGSGFQDMIAFGRYVDRFERRQDRWRIAARQVVFERDRVDPAPWEGSEMKDAVKGTRDRHDPSYQLSLVGEAPTEGLAAILEDAMARQEIHDALLRINRGADRADKGLIAAGFHPDAEANYGAFVGPPDDLADWVVDRQTTDATRSVHFLGNELIHVTGNSAQCESYFLRTQRFMRDGSPADLVEQGRYLDVFEKRNGAWKIAKRVVVLDISRVDPVVAEFQGPVTQATVKGLRSRQDLSYELLGEA